MEESNLKDDSKCDKLDTIQYNLHLESYPLLDESARYDFILKVTQSEENIGATDLQGSLLNLMLSETSSRIRYAAYSWVLSIEKSGNNELQWMQNEWQIVDIQEAKQKRRAQISNDLSPSIRALFEAHTYINDKLQKSHILIYENFDEDEDPEEEEKPENSGKWEQAPPFLTLSNDVQLEVLRQIHYARREAKECFREQIFSILGDENICANDLTDQKISQLLDYIKADAKKLPEDYWNRYDGFTRYLGGKLLDDYWGLLTESLNISIQTGLAEILPIPYLYNIPNLNNFSEKVLQTILDRNHFQENEFRKKVIFSEYLEETKGAAASGLKIDLETLIDISKMEDKRAKNYVLCRMARNEENIISILDSCALLEILSDLPITRDWDYHLIDLAKESLSKALRSRISAYPFEEQRHLEPSLRLLEFSLVSIKSNFDLSKYHERIGPHVIPGDFLGTLRNLVNNRLYWLMPMDEFRVDILTDLGFYTEIEKQEKEDNRWKDVDVIKSLSSESLDVVKRLRSQIEELEYRGESILRVLEREDSKNELNQLRWSIIQSTEKANQSAIKIFSSLQTLSILISIVFLLTVSYGLYIAYLYFRSF